MPKRKAIRIPSYRLHKPSHRAVVTIAGRDYYLGAYGSQESREKYGQLIAKHVTGVPINEKQDPLSPRLTVAELVLIYVLHAKSYYQKNGKVTDEFSCIKSAASLLIELYAETDASKFMAGQLKAVRQRMIDLKWSRGYINNSVQRIRRMFRHAISNDLIPPEILTKLESVAPLMRGRSAAVELPPRTAVPQEHIDAVRADVNQHTRDLIDLALLSGARPGELCMLTEAMLDRSGDVWVADLDDHKMVHHGRRRVIAFGPKSQAILEPYLQKRKTRKLFPITRNTFTDNIKASCLRLGLPKFTAHWLRHSAATAIRRESGLDAAQAVLGHSSASTTEIYAHLDLSKIIELARQRG